MNHLNDEILNKYIDNELSGRELSDINDHIKICDQCLNLIKAHKLADQQLKKLELFSPSKDFTEILMKKVHLVARPFQPKKSYFFRFVFSFMLIGALGVVIAAFASIPADTSQGISVNEYVYEEIIHFFSGYKNIITSRNASIVGAVLSFVILISAYFIYDSHKNFKNRLEKLTR